jgi:hypothetical protein
MDERRLCSTVAPGILNLPGVVGVHFCVGDQAASNIPTVEKTFRPAADLSAPSVIIIEGSSASSVQSAANSAADEVKSQVDVAVYQLENSRSNLSEAQRRQSASRLRKPERD